MRAVVVTPSLDWRLHGFDMLSEHQPATSIDWPLMHASWIVGAQYKSAEVCCIEEKCSRTDTVPQKLLERCICK